MYELYAYVRYKHKLRNDFSKRYVKDLKAKMTKLMADKGWNEFPFGFVAPFDADEVYVCIGQLVGERNGSIIVGDTLYLMN